jgi:hypothetical protein
VVSLGFHTNEHNYPDTMLTQQEANSALIIRFYENFTPNDRKDELVIGLGLNLFVGNTEPAQRKKI